MIRLILGLSLAGSGWVCAGIYLLLTARAVGRAVSGADPASVGDAVAMMGLGIVSWASLVWLGSLFGVPAPRFLRRRKR